MANLKEFLIWTLKILRMLPYRHKVCGVVTDGHNNFLIVQLTSYGVSEWNFPGGGIEAGESIKKAVERELAEELGSRKFKIINQSKIISRYDWPSEIVWEKIKTKNQYFRGQSASYVHLKFIGNKGELKINPGEIRKLKWIKRSDFKKFFVFSNQYSETLAVLNNLGL